ncbi:MAG: hypothetical protein JOZ84_05520, partial [Methylobacteriaceae bacterium]|nr:hypothetical protein [Methylobacteriaceae bacterium]
MADDAQSLSIVIRGTVPVRLWHRRLAAALKRHGHEVALEFETSKEAHSAGLGLVLEFERLAYGIRSTAFERQDAAPQQARTRADIVVDLRERPSSQANAIVLAPLFDGVPGEAALIAALLGNEAPEITIVRWDGAPQAIARALPVVENRSILAQGLDQVLARLENLLRQCVTRIARGDQLHGQPASLARAHTPYAVLFAAKGVAAKIAQRLKQLVVHPEHWRVAFRQLANDATIASGKWPDANWTRVPDDRQRYFADPFPFVENGRTYVFCEEYPYATRKGIISLFEIVDGRPTKPRPVLERPYHLSYPFVFRRGSEIYMIPETSSVGRIELYRADPFPERWTFERVLIEDVMASDATLVTWNDRDWLFASVAGEGASTWDALGLFYADDLFGAWQPHPLNPVLIDAGAARPGGAMVVQGNRLRRVAQDCRKLYGGGIVLADVEQLDPENYAQTVSAV